MVVVEMEVKEVVRIDEVVMEDMDVVEDACERVFKVGELVEFWAGPVVRAYRTDSGEPAYVKEIYGQGWYGIKMVGSFGGRNRRVNWKSLFKDGSFQKQVGSGFGARVRTSGRRLERVRLAAEAKFEDALRASKRDLSKAERQQEALTKDVEERLKRQERETRKDAKDLSAGFKRQLEEMRDENREVMQALRDDVEEKERGTRINVRELRQKVSSLMEQVGQEKQDQADLAKHLRKEQKKRTVLMGTVDAWKDRHADLDHKTIEKDNRLKVLERDLAETVRERKTLVIREERDVLSNRLEVDKLKRKRQDLNEQLAKSREDVSMLAEQSCQVCSCHCNRLASSQFFPYPFYDTVEETARSSHSIREGVGTKQV